MLEQDFPLRKTRNPLSTRDGDGPGQCRHLEPMRTWEPVRCLGGLCGKLRYQKGFVCACYSLVHWKHRGNVSTPIPLESSACSPGEAKRLFMTWLTYTGHTTPGENIPGGGGSTGERSGWNEKPYLLTVTVIRGCLHGLQFGLYLIWSINCCTGICMYMRSHFGLVFVFC